MPKKPAPNPIPHPVLLDEVLRTLHEDYRLYLTVQLFIVLRTGKADARKEVHHG